MAETPVNAWGPYNTKPEAINAIEGLAISTESEQQLEKWKNGEIAFYQFFEDALKKYGFPI